MEILQGEIGSEITVKALENKQSIMINSPGGSLFEGLAMYDYVKAKDIEIGVIGLCASAATLPLLASSKRWGTPNSRYLIHNPMINVFLEQFNADDLEKQADQLRKEQERALELYFQILNKSKEEIKNLMDKDIIIDAIEAKELGLILEIRDIENEEKTTDLKLLYNKFKMQIMEKSDLKTELAEMKTTLNGIAKQINPKMLVLQDVNGKEIDFGNEVETPEQVKVGVKATVEGAPAEGDFVMPSGETYVFVKGELMEIKPAVNDNEELKKEIEDLKVENEILKEEKEAQMQINKDIQAKLKMVSDKLDSIQSKFTTDKPKDVMPPIEKEKAEAMRFSFKKKIINN